MKFILEANGFDVIDLGIDVSAKRFIKNIKEFKPKILVLSGFSMFAFELMKEVIQEIKEADHFLKDIISPNFTSIF